MQKVKASQGISYSEAVKKVPRITPVLKQNERREDNHDKSTNDCEGCNKSEREDLAINKSDFVLFVAEIINCSAQTQSRKKIIKIIVRAAEKYLGIKGLLWESQRQPKHR